MTEMERFESRFETALVRLADEVPTTVDAAEVAHSIATGKARHGWLPGILAGVRPRSRGLAPILRLGIASGMLLLLAFGLFALAQRTDPPPADGLLAGRMTCGGSSWTSATGPVVLDCVIDLPDRHLAGPVSIKLGEGAPIGGFHARAGTIELDASGASWTGELELARAPNGLAVGDAELIGRRDAAGLVLRVHLISTDGLDWGALGWIESTR